MKTHSAYRGEGQEPRIASHDSNDKLQGCFCDDANETDEAGQLDESRSRSDCMELKLLSVWLDKRDTLSFG